MNTPTKNIAIVIRMENSNSKMAFQRLNKTTGTHTINGKVQWIREHQSKKALSKIRIDSSLRDTKFFSLISIILRHKFTIFLSIRNRIELVLSHI